MWDRAEDQA